MDITNIQDKVRYLLNDSTKSGKDIFTYGNSSVFTLTESNALAVSNVSVNDVSSGVTYSYYSVNNKVTVSSALIAGDIVEIDYTYYSDYSATELLGYIHSALVHISINGYAEFLLTGNDIYPAPTDKEQNLIAALAALIAKPDNKSIRMPDISITGPLINDLPLDKKISRLIAIFKKDSHGVFGNT